MFKLQLPKIDLGKQTLNKPVVVEIGVDWLKIIEARPTQAGGEISRLALHKISQAKESPSMAIDRIFKELSLGRQSVMLVIPRQLITLRVLDLPSVDPKEIGDMVNLQVGKQTPYSKEEIVSAYKITPGIREGYTKVILAVSHKDVVNERIEALRNAGINIVKVAISSEGVYNWFAAAYSHEFNAMGFETVALLDIDSNYSDFIAIRDGKMVFTKNIFIGANHLSEGGEAARKKLVEELKGCVRRYQVEERSARINKIFLTGALKNTEDLDIALSNALNMAAEKTDTFKNIKIDHNLNKSLAQDMGSASITSIIGVSLRCGHIEIDLMPGEQKIFKLMEKKRKDLMIMGILFLAIVMSLSFLLLISLYYKNAYLVQLKKQATEMSKESGNIEKMRSSVEMVKKMLDPKNSALEILREIYNIVPSEISLSSVDIEDSKQAILKGRAQAMSDVFKFIKKLEESKMFANVKTSYTRTKKGRSGETETEYAEFEIVCPCEGR